MNDPYGRRRDDRRRFGRFEESEQGRYRGPSGQSEWEQQGQGSLSEGRFQEEGFGQDGGYNFGQSHSEGASGSGGRFGRGDSDWNDGRYRSEPGNWRGPEGTYGQSTQGRGGWPGRGGYDEERGRGARDWGSSETSYGWRGDEKSRSGDFRRGGWGGGQQDWATSGSASRHGVHSGYGATEGADLDRQRYGGSFGYGYGEGRSRSGSMIRPESGRHSGKGPKGYTRSDERIKEQLSEKLEEHGDIDASELTVEVKNGEVTLEGTVPDRSMKRMAEDIAEDCPGVKDVQNRLRVEKGDGSEHSSHERKESHSGTGSSTSGSTPGSEKNRSRSTI